MGGVYGEYLCREDRRSESHSLVDGVGESDLEVDKTVEEKPS